MLKLKQRGYPRNFLKLSGWISRLSGKRLKSSVVQQCQMQYDEWNVETLTAPHPDTGLACSWTLQFKKRSYNEGQRDALLLNFILTKNFTCFGQIFCPSSGFLLLYSQQYVFCRASYDDRQLPRSGWNSRSFILTSVADSHQTIMAKYLLLQIQ